MQTLFYILAGTALVAGALVVFQTHPLRSALWLIVNFFAVAGIYLLASAEFIAAIQIIVYAGAIMVLFLFVIMLLNLRQPEEPMPMSALGSRILAVTLAVTTGFLVMFGLKQAVIIPARTGPPGLGNTESVARLLFTDYLLPFEVTSVLLLVAIVGAVILSKSRLK
ncbi:MAG: NADH-quinone oxidoreductase subunit J [Deltaproteobacteria bacterium]|nr:NADH-quinone oxidoreductase subunit J [Deltaproteobacteria bacterium]